MAFKVALIPVLSISPNGRMAEKSDQSVTSGELKDTLVTEEGYDEVTEYLKLSLAERKKLLWKILKESQALDVGHWESYVLLCEEEDDLQKSD